MTARGDQGQSGPALRDVEKQEGSKGEGGDEAAKSPSGGDAAEPERDEDGVAMEEGVPIVRLTGPDDPMSCVSSPFVHLAAALER